MDYKHIYSTSFFSILQDRLNKFKNEVFSHQKPKPTIIPPTPIPVIQEQNIQQPNVQTIIQMGKEKVKVKKVKKEKVKKFHYRKIANVSLQKTLVISLAIAIICIVGVGILLTYKENLYPTTHQDSRSELQNIAANPSLNIVDNWKTYRNTALKIEFKIPREFTVFEGSNYNLIVFKEQQKTVTTAHEIESDIQIFVNANKDGEYENYNKVISARKKIDRYPSSLQVKEKEKYFIFSGWWPGPFSEGNYYASEAIIKYEDGAVSFKQRHEPNENTFLLEQILSSFQFLD